ncbi:hypothetical protein E8E12_000800 [Didymella heteroderae]|uniref:Uncharacterized protein n=1 Tax=Didymella heteroderae TaxID=1769908 RepID=A0A9P4WGL0_9PLEO|nr:hypothetical protein E8E12_000800 [Didymella heteroderae]
MPCDSRSPGDARNIKQSIAELKLRRIEELNQRLQEDLMGKHKDRYPPPQDNSCCTAM